MFSFRLIKTTIRLHVCLTALLCLHVPAFSAGQAEQAVRQVEQLIASGAIQRGEVLTIAVKQGNINNFWGNNYELKRRWEDTTGTIIDTVIIPQKPVKEFLEEAEGIDITVARQREYPDLVDNGLIIDLTGRLANFGFQLKGEPPFGYLHPERQARYDEKIYAIPADGDIAVLYLRSDLLEEAGNRKEFRKRYSHELRAPQSWQEYLRQVEFFHRPDDSMFGSCEQRNPDSAWMFWMPRFVSTRSPNMYLFDQEMHPLIDSPEGVAATESYLATVPFSPPGITEPNNDYSYTLPLFLQGKCYSMIITLSLTKLLNGDNSKVKGKFKIFPMPGWNIDGHIHSRTSYIYGNNLVIPANSENKELALLYAMWLTDPEISLQSIMVKTGIADPYRHHHYHDERLDSIYTRQALDAAYAQINKVVPAGTGLPGDFRYIQVLNHYLWMASKGEIDAPAAMRQVAERWETITEEYGRQRQKHYWRIFKKKFPRDD